MHVCMCFCGRGLPHMLQVCGDLSCGIVCVIENTLIGVRNLVKGASSPLLCLSLSRIPLRFHGCLFCPVAPSFRPFLSRCPCPVSVL